MSTMSDALRNVYSEENGFTPVKLQLHKFPFGVVNSKAGFGSKMKDVENAERFVQNLFSNFQVQSIDIDTIELGSNADRMNRWALEMLSQYSDKAYAFVEPFMVPEKIGFDMVPFYFRYDPTLKKLEMKMGIGVDIAETFRANGLEFTKEELSNALMFNNIVSAYLQNSPIVIVEIGQQLPLYEYPDVPWRFSTIKKDERTMEKLQSYLDTLTYPPREDRFYFIKSKMIIRKETGKHERVYWLAREENPTKKKKQEPAESEPEQNTQEAPIQESEPATEATE